MSLSSSEPGKPWHVLYHEQSSCPVEKLAYVPWPHRRTRACDPSSALTKVACARSLQTSPGRKSLRRYIRASTTHCAMFPCRRILPRRNCLRRKKRPARPRTARGSATMSRPPAKRTHLTTPRAPGKRASITNRLPATTAIPRSIARRSRAANTAGTPRGMLNKTPWRATAWMVRSGLYTCVTR